MDVTMVISLLQRAPGTYNIFDDVILLSEGQIVYQGPRQDVLEFFEFMGCRCPERKGVADVLQEVTSRKDQEQYCLKFVDDLSSTLNKVSTVGDPELLGNVKDHMIGNLLPDDEDELLAGIIDGCDRSGFTNQVDDSEEYDPFGSGGGLELEYDHCGSLLNVSPSLVIYSSKDQTHRSVSVSDPSERVRAS